MKRVHPKVFAASTPPPFSFPHPVFPKKARLSFVPSPLLYVFYPFLVLVQVFCRSALSGNIKDYKQNPCRWISYA